MKQSLASRHALAFIFVTVLIDAMGLGIIIPVLPKLISTIAHVGLDNAARYGAWLAFAYAGMQFLFSPLLGNLSDRFGRRPILIMSLVGICIDYSIMGFAPDIIWLFVGRTLSGIAGASYTTAAAYIADVTPAEKRAQSFGLIGAAFGVGFVAGPALGGIISAFGVRAPFFASAALAAMNALYGMFVLSESLRRENRRSFQFWRANPLGALMSMRRFPVVLPMCSVLILMRLAHDANPNVFSYYTMLKFHWTPMQVSGSLVVIGIIISLSYAILPRLISVIGEARAVYIGLLGGALSFAGYAFASSGWMMYAWMLPFGLVAMAMPAINAIMSKEVGASEQGALQGAVTSLGSLTSVFAPILLGNLFAYFSGPRAPVYFPGAAFLAAAVFMVLAALLFAIVGPQARAQSAAQSAQ
jgi:DHA1 family tetracycline resistance protein-like MFS transporter